VGVIQLNSRTINAADTTRLVAWANDLIARL
jgi:hypothetical protein